MQFKYTTRKLQKNIFFQARDPAPKECSGEAKGGEKGGGEREKTRGSKHQQSDLWQRRQFQTTKKGEVNLWFLSLIARDENQNVWERHMST